MLGLRVDIDPEPRPGPGRLGDADAEGYYSFRQVHILFATK